MDTRKNALTAGVVLIALAAGGFVIWRNSKVTCALTAAGVASIVTGVTHGRPVGQIVGVAAAGAFVPEACTSVIESLIETPQQEVTIELQLPTGATLDQTVTGTVLLSPPPEDPPDVDIARLIDCLGWKSSSFLFDLCVDGVISPRAA